MKKLCNVLFLLLFLSCNTFEEDVIWDSGLEGQWTLINISCFCGFTQETDFTQTSLIFDTDNDRLTVVQNGNQSFFREAGTYAYGGESTHIGFSDNTVYRFELNGDILRLEYQDDPQIADDEVVYTFEKQ